jgi:hypothetical protein
MDLAFKGRGRSVEERHCWLVLVREAMVLQKDDLFD